MDECGDVGLVGDELCEMQDKRGYGRAISRPVKGEAGAVQNVSEGLS